MKANLISLSVILLIGLIVFVSASNFSGDGAYTIKKGDVITLDNGWKVEVLGITNYQEGQITFNILDQDGKYYPSQPYVNTLLKAEGGKKYGTDTTLKIRAELLDIGGNTYATGSPMVTEYEEARLTVESIDEALPGTVVGVSELTEEINKVLTYKDGKDVTMNVGEAIVLGNGYTLKLDKIVPEGERQTGGARFILYDQNDNLIDNGIFIAKDYDKSLGSYVHLNNYTNDSVNLRVIDGSGVMFGTGWNLFSIYLADSDGYGTVLESTCNEGTMWVWNNELNDYENYGALREGARIPAGKGIFVNIQTKPNVIADMDCKIIVSGDNSVTTNGLQLKAGWNSIGAPISAYGKTEEFEGGSNFILLGFKDILGDCTLEKGPWQFLATPYTHTSIWTYDTGFTPHQFSQPQETRLRLGRGYFIKVANDCTLGDK